MSYDRAIIPLGISDGISGEYLPVKKKYKNMHNWSRRVKKKKKKECAGSHNGHSNCWIILEGDPSKNTFSFLKNDFTELGEGVKRKMIFRYSNVFHFPSSCPNFHLTTSGKMKPTSSARLFKFEKKSETKILLWSCHPHRPTSVFVVYKGKELINEILIFWTGRLFL